MTIYEIPYVALVALLFASIAAWATHIIACLMSEQWLLLIAGAIAFPVGVVHGWGLWFGAW
jgi:hypothetical protein